MLRRVDRALGGRGRCYGTPRRGRHRRVGPTRMGRPLRGDLRRTATAPAGDVLPRPPAVNESGTFALERLASLGPFFTLRTNCLDDGPGWHPVTECLTDCAEGDPTHRR